MTDGVDAEGALDGIDADVEYSPTHPAVAANLVDGDGVADDVSAVGGFELDSDEGGGGAIGGDASSRSSHLREGGGGSGSGRRW